MRARNKLPADTSEISNQASSLRIFSLSFLLSPTQSNLHLSESQDQRVSFGVKILMLTLEEELYQWPKCHVPTSHSRDTLINYKFAGLLLKLNI
jgi:hypothetical protein